MFLCGDGFWRKGLTYVVTQFLLVATKEKVIESATRDFERKASCTPSISSNTVLVNPYRGVMKERRKRASGVRVLYPSFQQHPCKVYQRISTSSTLSVSHKPRT
jgi:hypothetical protein